MVIQLSRENCKILLEVNIIKPFSNDEHVVKNDDSIDEKKQVPPLLLGGTCFNNDYKDILL